MTDRDLDRTVAFLAIVSAVIALAGVGVCLSRIDRLAAARHSAAMDEIALDRSIVDAVGALADQVPALHVALTACRQRTESLHGVLEVLVSSGIGWPERVRLPDPPPGWAPWPALGHRDRAEAATDRDEQPQARRTR